MNGWLIKSVPRAVYNPSIRESDTQVAELSLSLTSQSQCSFGLASHWASTAQPTPFPVFPHPPWTAISLIQTAKLPEAWAVFLSLLVMPSQISVSSLHTGHAIVCIIPMLGHVLLKRAPSLRITNGAL